MGKTSNIGKKGLPNTTRYTRYTLYRHYRIVDSTGVLVLIPGPAGRPAQGFVVIPAGY